MTDKFKLFSILENQQERGIKSGDWKQLDYNELFDSTNQTYSVYIPNLQVIFEFNRSGRLVGAFNCKD